MDTRAGQPLAQHHLVGTPSIVVVEREALVADDLRSSLAHFGYDVLATAGTAFEAMAAVEAHRPDVVVVDVGLESRDDGIEAAAAIRARHPTPIVLLSSEADGDTLFRAQHDAQPYAFVLKPYRDAELRAAVEVALQRHAFEEEVRHQHALLATVLGGMTDAVVVEDLEGHVLLVNEASRRAFGGEHGDGSTAHAYLPDEETPWPKDDLPLAQAKRGNGVRDVEMFIRSERNPEGRWYSVNATPMRDARGATCGAVAVARDTTDLHAADSVLQRLAQTDALTGAYNRRGFMRVARAALDRAHRSGRQPAVFYIDLNGMKRVNDSLGHPEGDHLLTDCMAILRACFRATDIVGRIGGDEFVVLAPDAGAHADALRARLHSVVESFNTDAERAYRVSISVGMCADDPNGSVALDELMRRADERMYEDKQERSARRRGAGAPASVKPGGVGKRRSSTAPRAPKRTRRRG